MRLRVSTSVYEDLRFALRSFVARRNRSATSAVVLTLAVAIASCAIIVSLLDAALFRPLSLYDDGQLVSVDLVSRHASGTGSEVYDDVALFDAWRRQATVFDGIAAYQATTATLIGVGRPRRIQTVVATSGMMSLFHARPVIGRAFIPEDDYRGAAPVVIVSNAFWKAYLGGDPSATNRTLLLNGIRFDVIGVMPAGFRIPGSIPRTAEREVWLPMSAYGQVLHVSDPAAGSVTILARLRRNVSVDYAERQLDRIATSIGKSSGPSGAGALTRITPLRTLLRRQVRQTLVLLFGAVCFILLIASANVGNLLLLRAVGRTREIATRVALGAKRGRIVGQLATESLLLGLIGAVGGVIVALIALPLVVRFAGADLSAFGSGTISWRALLVILSLTLVSVALFAPGQIAIVLGTTPSSLLRDGTARSGTRRHRLAGALVAGELALTLVLLLGAALFTKSVLRFTQSGRGYDTDRIAFGLTALPDSIYDTPEKQLDFSRRLLQAARAIPGASDAAVATGMPILSGSSSAVGTSFEAASGKQRQIDAWAVTPGFFHTIGLPLRRGVLPKSLVDQGTIVIDAAATDLLFGGADPIGHRVYWDGGKHSGLVAAVVGNIEEVNNTVGKSAEMVRSTDPHLYLPFTEGSQVQFLLVRSEGDPSQLRAGIDSVFARVGPDAPLDLVTTVKGLLKERSQRNYMFAVVLAVFSVIALMMAGVGVYGTVAYATTQRTREMAVRLALGAPISSALALLMRRGLASAFIGIVAGTAVAMPLLGVVRHRLFEVPAFNVPLFLGVAAALLSVAATAVFVPSLRVLHTDLSTILREE